MRAIDEPATVNHTPEHYVVRVSATSKCNLDCRYCKPDKSRRTVMSDDDMLGIIEAGVKAGVKRASWTGGEPTIRPKIVESIAAARELGVQYQSITTNGVVFGNRAHEFGEAGIDRVNISLETLDRDEYAQITGADALDKVLHSIRESMRTIGTVKVNCVITRDNIRNILKFVDFAQDFKDGLTVRFLEVVPCENEYADNGDFFAKTFVSAQEMISELQGAGELTPKQITGNVPKSKYFKISGKKGIFGVNPNHSVQFHCDREECTKIRVNPQGIVSNCTIDLSFCRDFSGLSQAEKDALMLEIVREKIERNYTGFLHRQRYYDFWRFGTPHPDYKGRLDSCTESRDDRLSPKGCSWD
ncbi:radical SAM protein [Patescibacteria group bacterium]|nr:radical SAM protein [Patescibacteria group bacterium]